MNRNEWSDQVYKNWLREAVLISKASLPQETTLIWLIGYNPQRLLTDQSSIFPRLWDREVLQGLMESFYPSHLPADEFINFEPRYRNEVIYLATPTGRVVAEQYRRVEIDRVNLAPFVVPRGQMSYPTIQPPETTHERYAADFSVPRWGESDADPLADIPKIIERFRGTVEKKAGVFFVGGDYSQLEAYMLASMLHSSSGKTDGSSIFLHLEGQGSIPGLREKRPAVKQNGRSASYLDHDPTKRHNRRKRR